VVTRLLAACMLLAALAGCSRQLYGNLSETDANEIVGALRVEGVSADKRQGAEQHWRVEVPDREFTRAVSVMRNQNLPAQSFDGLGSVFRKDSLVSTEVEERARFTYALAQELQRTLSQIDGVVLARVHPVVVSNDQFTAKPKVASASVFIKHRANIDLSARTQLIRELVANGIEGLPPERVSVALFPVHAKAPLPTTNTAAPVQTSAFELEGFWLGAAAIMGVLLAIAGAAAAWLRLRPRSRSEANASAPKWADSSQFAPGQASP
jgi:type III secretion protein J